MVYCNLSGEVEMNENLSGIFDDDGNKISPDLIPKPSLCVSCRKDGMAGEEEILCALTRSDQQGEEEFQCYAYEPKERHA